MEVDNQNPESDTEITILEDDSPESGIEALRQQIAEATARAEEAVRARDAERVARQSESQAREEAERRARQMTEEAQYTRRSAHESQYDSVINALAAAQSDLAGIKSRYKDAMAEGDFDKAADLAGDIGLAASRVREFESGKTALDQQRQAGNQQQSQQSSQDPREDYLRRMPPRTASWLRRNDRFFSDPTFMRMVQGADAIARGRGIEPESDAYFQFIEEQSGLRDPQTEARTDAPASPLSTAGQTTPPRQAAAPAAGSTQSATRSTPRAGEVRLTAEERDLCRTMDISEAAYARQKLAALTRGEIGGGR